MDLQMQARRRTNQPCAACRMLRRRCDDNCLLARYFPANEADNFVQVHKVFGSSNVSKLLQTLEETEREDAVKSMVYEANARVREPIYGCAGIIFGLQKHIKDLEQQLQVIKAQFIESKSQRDQLLSILMDVYQSNPFTPINDVIFDGYDLLLDANTIGCNPC